MKFLRYQVLVTWTVSGGTEKKLCFRRLTKVLCFKAILKQTHFNNVSTCASLSYCHLDLKPLSEEVNEASSLRLLGAENENAELRRRLEHLQAEQEVSGCLASFILR